MRTFTLKLDHLPDPLLNPNKLRRLHWSVRSNASLIARQEAGWIAKSQWRDEKAMWKVEVSYLFRVKDNRKHDIDNLLAASKPIIDGLIDAGVMASDDYRLMSIGGALIVKDTQEATEITLREA